MLDQGLGAAFGVDAVSTELPVGALRADRADVHVRADFSGDDVAALHTTTADPCKARRCLTIGMERLLISISLMALAAAASVRSLFVTLAMMELLVAVSLAPLGSLGPVFGPSGALASWRPAPFRLASSCCRLPFRLLSSLSFPCVGVVVPSPSAPPSSSLWFPCRLLSAAPPGVGRAPPETPEGVCSCRCFN
ncbi:unnamed protein product [Prorocentrum cordatum]|uniref:Solute carrier family 40 protein n=1 Tax=Prorocentrum cordatum TaxID=2364126 RepID=A0ABN9V6W6_9DINO|nr:unnamed protein product [Polarella glacialis]